MHHTCLTRFCRNRMCVKFCLDYLVKKFETSIFESTSRYSKSSTSVPARRQQLKPRVQASQCRPVLVRGQGMQAAVLKVICKMAKPTELAARLLSPVRSVPQLEPSSFAKWMHFLQFESESRHGLSAAQYRGQPPPRPWRQVRIAMVAGLKKHQPRRAPRRRQPSKFAYTVVVRQSAFQGQQRAFTSLMLPGGICNQPLKTAATRARACCTVCLRRRHGHHLQGPLNRACSAKISHARKGAAAVIAAAATVEVAKAPLHARGTTTGILLFQTKNFTCKPMRNCIRFAYKMSDFLCVMTSIIGKVKSNILYRQN